MKNKFKHVTWEELTDTESDFQKEMKAKYNQKKLYETQLKTLQHEQVTDVYAPFLTRLDRYVKIRCIKLLLNKFYL